MRVGRVVGKLSLRRVHPTLVGKRWIVVVPQTLPMLLADGATDGAGPEELIAVDELGAGPNDLIAFSEGGEATVPYLPDDKPVDAYTACLLDHVDVDRGAAEAVLRGGSDEVKGGRR
ncbi:MAG: EutN/CcmL family microcompartment protein [Planctomycetia bacterium]